jgi:Na+/H+ antiporter NhaD/arsenite permease-like protein
LAPGDRPDVVPAIEVDKLKQVRLQDYLLRFALGAVISIGAGIIAKAVGARFGGMFLAFPAILPASLTLIQDKEGTRRADRNAIGAVLGAVGLVVFAALGEASFGHIQSFVALLGALTGWVVVSFALYALLAVLQPDDCDRRKD